MSDVSRIPCETHLTAMKVFLLLLVITSAYDTLNAQALEDDVQDDYAVDYAGKDDVEKPKDTPDVAASIGSSESKSAKSHHHHHKHSKTHKYWKATVEFLKKTLNPNTLMQNQWFTEMLRKFSHSEDPPEEEIESEEYEEEVHTLPPPTKRRRGRPRKRLNAGSLEKPGLTGIFKKGLKKISTIDKKKLRRKIRMMKKMARKAKRPLKSVVKFYLSSKNTNNAYGNTGYGAGNTY